MARVSLVHATLFEVVVELHEPAALFGKLFASPLITMMMVFLSGSIPPKDLVQQILFHQGETLLHIEEIRIARKGCQLY